MERVALLPHVGSATAETRLRMALVACENLLTALRGQRPPNLVNRRRSSGEPLDRGSFAIEIQEMVYPDVTGLSTQIHMTGNS
jgi:hypothetical protein